MAVGALHALEELQALLIVSLVAALPQVNDLVDPGREVHQRVSRLPARQRLIGASQSAGKRQTRLSVHYSGTYMEGIF